MPMSTQPVRMWFGPMSGGDKARFVAELNAKQIAFTESENKLFTTPAVSSGDQPGLMKLAIEIGNIGYGPVVTGGGIPQSQYDAAVAAQKAAETRVAELSNKITVAQSHANACLTAAQNTVNVLK